MNQRKRALHEAEALKRKLAENTASAISHLIRQRLIQHVDQKQIPGFKI